MNKSAGFPINKHKHRCSKIKKDGFGSVCFRNINGKATFKIPAKMFDKYKGWIQKQGKAPSSAGFEKLK